MERPQGEFRDVTTSCQYSQPGVPPQIEFASPIQGFTDIRGRVPAGYVVEMGTSIGPFPAALKATEQNISQAKAGNGKIYCQGLLLYEDVRSTEHTTRVCWVYNFGVGAFTLCPENGANYHN
jgi:hypothetical protein